MKTVKYAALIIGMSLFTVSCGNQTSASSSSSADSTTSSSSSVASPSPDNPPASTPTTDSLHANTSDTGSKAQ